MAAMVARWTGIAFDVSAVLAVDQHAWAHIFYDRYALFVCCFVLLLAERF
jgi:hypothetical protein